MTARKFAEDGALAWPGAALVRRFGRVGGEFIRYGACGAAALALDMSLFALGLAAGLNYSIAAAIGFMAGLVVAYVLSVRFVFRERRLADERAEFAVFAVVGLGGLLLTEVLLWLFIGQRHWHPVLAKVVTAGLVFGFNFGARKLLLFTKPVPSR